MEHHELSHDNIILFPEFATLKEEVNRLRIELSMLVLERDELLLIECQNIEHRYMLAVGHLEYKSYDLHCHLLRLKRKIDLIQAQKNRQEPVHLSKIEQQLDEEFTQYQQQLQEQLEKLNEAFAWQKGEPLTKEQVRELKKLYREIVKVLHPDLNPNLSEEELKLFRHAVEAYECGDLATLQMIRTVVADDTLPLQHDDSLAMLIKEKERLIQLVEILRQNIVEIKEQYPYTLKEMVRDKAQLEAKRVELEALIKQLKETIELYQHKIDEMLR